MSSPNSNTTTDTSSSPSSAFVLNVCVCGGGNGAHALAALAGSQTDKFRVSVLTLFADEAERWSAAAAAAGGTTARRDGERITAKLHHVSKRVEDVIPSADVIVFVMPAFAHASYLEAIKPHISADRSVLLATMPAQGGFDLCVRSILGQAKNVTLAGMETLPWACRLEKYGALVDILGTKQQVDVTVAPRQGTAAAVETLQALIGPMPKLCVLDNFLNTTLMNINSVWHPTITYGAYREWDFKTPFDEPPLFYEGVDKFTADKLTAVSDEIVALKRVLEKEYGIKLDGVRHVREWMKRSYDGDMADETNLMTMINSNKGYQGLTHPMRKTDDGRFLPNFRHRYVSEDVPCGLVVTRGIAHLAGVATPNLDEVVRFAEKALGKDFLGANGDMKGADVSSSRAPQAYGISSIDELVRSFGYTTDGSN